MWYFSFVDWLISLSMNGGRIDGRIPSPVPKQKERAAVIIVFKLQYKSQPATKIQILLITLFTYESFQRIKIYSINYNAIKMPML